ncbi:MAG TPA: hypothetical protein VKZ49_07135 [Polyangiaceae bacterium]|nr:hypothetical protein [Polyangiaceae bacterium]
MGNDDFLTRSVARALEQEASTRGHAVKGGLRRATARVLVAMSDEARAGAVGGWLSGAGHDVTVVFSAAEAGRQSGRFDCGVFADQLSDGPGAAVAAQLARDDRLATVLFRPAAALTLDESDDWAMAGELMDLEAAVSAALREATLREAKPRRGAAGQRRAA